MRVIPVGRLSALSLAACKTQEIALTPNPLHASEKRGPRWHE